MAEPGSEALGAGMGAAWEALGLSLRLGLVTVALLLPLAALLAWWLAGRGRLRPWLEAAVALPLVLPPTVLGFYLLLAFAPEGWLGGWWARLTGRGLAFSFAGLVLASLVYSLPFAVQPLLAAFDRLRPSVVERAGVLGVPPGRAFLELGLPQARRALLAAAALSFAHTLGEFGVVLMVGGAVPGQTRVVSVALYEAVEGLDLASAHALAAVLLAVALLALGATYGGRRGW